LFLGSLLKEINLPGQARDSIVYLPTQLQVLAEGEGVGVGEGLGTGDGDGCDGDGEGEGEGEGDGDGIGAGGIFILAINTFGRIAHGLGGPLAVG
jgi:hypothetical protein